MLPGHVLDPGIQLGDLGCLDRVNRHQLLDVLPGPVEFVSRLVAFGFDQASMLAQHLNMRGHAQREAVVFDDRGAAYQYCLYIQKSRWGNSGQLRVTSCR